VVLCLLALVTAATTGCGELPHPSQERGEGPGQRRQPLGMTPAEELAVGRRAYQQVMEEVKGRVLPAEHPQVQRTRRVMARLVQAARIPQLRQEINLRTRAYRFEWETNVIRDKQVNAFCLPAGKMFIYTGILPVIGNDDDFLATVLAHEMSHALAHHASERIAREKSGEGIMRSLRYNREQEAEADHIGVFLMALAGYNPEKAVQFWERMRQATGGRAGLPEWLSDHPNDEHRIRALRQWAPRARAAKEAFDRGAVAPAKEES